MRPHLLLAAVLFACGREAPAPPARPARDTAAVDSTMALVARAAAVTLGAREFPARSDSVLEASGLTIEEYEALIYRIAADPVLASLYGDAIGGRN